MPALRPGDVLSPLADSGAPEARIATDTGVVANLPSAGSSPTMVVASALGPIFAFHFDDQTSFVSNPQTLDLGRPVQSMARRPKTDRWYVATQDPGGTTVTVHMINLAADGRLTQTAAGVVGTKQVTFLTFDQSGGWLLFTADRAFGAAPLMPDGSLGPIQMMGNCDSRGLIATANNSALLALCAYDNQLLRMDFNPQTGPAAPRVQIKFSLVNPVAIIPWDSRLLVMGTHQNGVKETDNNLAVVTESGAAALGQLKVRPPELDMMSAPWATAIVKHPQLAVAYVLNGATYQYGGTHLAVVGTNPAGALEVRQFVEMFPQSFALGISLDGRWLCEGNSQVGHVRSWSVDPATGQLTPGKVIALIDQPIYVGFR